MGPRQGVRRWKRGFTRRLTPSESRRGYLFISKDKAFSELIDVNRFEIDVEDCILPNRSLDSHGRVYLGLTLTQDLGSGTLLRFGVHSPSRLIVRRIAAETPHTAT